MRRASALAASLAMVVVAVLIRGAIDDEPADRGDGDVVVVCPPELRDACGALGPAVTVRVEPAAATLAALERGGLPDEVDGWLTTNAWLEVLTSRVPDADRSVQVVATTRPAVAADPDRAAAVGRLCGASTLWRCLGDNAGLPWAQLRGDGRWGALRTGLPDPDSATGLGVLASVAAGYFGSIDFAANDFDDGTFDTWLATLAGTRTAPDADPLSTLVTRRGTYSTAAGTEARASTIGRSLTTLPVSPDLTVQAVLVGFGRDPVPDGTAAGRALGEAGWVVEEDGGDVVRLLKAGVLAALHTRWTEVVG